MASPYKSGGSDFDALFAPRGTATPGPDTGYRIAGVDLSQRYAPSSGPSDRIAGPTGYKVAGGSDLQAYFRRFSTGPIITTHPSSGTVVEGNNLTLTVVATGTGTLTYQWKKNGSAISGATSSSYSFTPISRTNAASYTCDVTDINGTATSNAAVIDVLYLPTITSHPTDRSVVDGDSVSFAVSITEGRPSPATYQWQVDGVNITGGKYSGWNTNTLSFVSSTSDDLAQYRCIVTNAAGSVTSNIAKLFVNAIADPVIATSPSSIFATAGNGPYALQCSATTAGTGTHYFAWFKNNVQVIAPRLGNLGPYSDQHVFNPILQSDAGTWRCQVTTVYGGRVNSANATVSVSVDHPVITSSPSGFSAPDGSGPIALQCSATGGIGGRQFAWYRNGALVSGPRSGNISSTQDQHVFNPVTFGDAGTWHCRVTTPYGGDTSSGSAVVTIT